jgi:hypothetical protein
MMEIISSNDSLNKNNIKDWNKNLENIIWKLGVDL